MKLRVLSETDLRAAVDMPAAIDAMRAAFAALSAGRAVVPLRNSLESDDGVTLFMPAYLPADAAGGGLAAKIVSVFDGNPARGLPAITGVVLVLDPETGRPRALLDGTYLTALRTGAASGLATELLARENAAVLAVFGAGAQARTQIAAVRAVRPIREVRIVSRTRESAERLAAELRSGEGDRAGAPAAHPGTSAAGPEGVEVHALQDRAAALRGADVVVAATNSRTPVFPGAAVEPGTHINAVGAYTPEMQEVDAELVRRADRIAVGSREAALAEAGDLIVPIRDGVIMADDIHAELGELAAGTRPGREAPDEITFFKSVGNAVQDIAVAARALDAAERRGLGTVVEL